MSAAINGIGSPVRCSTAYGYGRQSHRDQIDAAEGIPQQGARTKAYFNGQLEPLGVQWGGFIPDESAVSARTNPMILLPALFRTQRHVGYRSGQLQAVAIPIGPQPPKAVHLVGF